MRNWKSGEYSKKKVPLGEITDFFLFWKIDTTGVPRKLFCPLCKLLCFSKMVHHKKYIIAKWALLVVNLNHSYVSYYLFSNGDFLKKSPVDSLTSHSCEKFLNFQTKKCYGIHHLVPLWALRPRIILSKLLVFNFQVRFAKRATFQHKVLPSVNSYLAPAHTLLINGLCGSYSSVRPG